MNNEHCIFCSGLTKNIHTSSFKCGIDDLISIECEYCGTYHIEEDLLEDNFISGMFLPHHVKKNHECEYIKAIPIWIKKRSPNTVTQVGRGKVFVFNDFINLKIEHSQKNSDILKLIAKRAVNTDNPFAALKFGPKEMHSLGIQIQDEIEEWLYHLYNEGLIFLPKYKKDEKIDFNKIRSQITRFEAEFALTAKGWEEVEKLNKGLNSKKVFIAMSFKMSDRENVQLAIESACRNTGWEGFTVDHTEYLGGVSDEIIALINKSAFVISDFTENKHGVYYEAGYAEGKGLPVIYTVRNDETEIENLHFDTQHLNHLTWNDFEDLEKKLTNKINAVINKRT